MRAITERAHACAALVLWDLSHSAGAVEVDLHGCDADMAVGCGHKYLNGGPGARRSSTCIAAGTSGRPRRCPGGMGHARPFDLSTITSQPKRSGVFCAARRALRARRRSRPGIELLVEAGIERSAAGNRALAAIVHRSRRVDVSARRAAAREPGRRGPLWQPRVLRASARGLFDHAGADRARR